MKRAIVLFMTIGFIAIISALVIISLSISQKSFNQVVYASSENQFSVVFKDFVNILNANSAKVDTKEKLDLFLATIIPPMREPKTGVTVGFFPESQMGKLNINYILDQIRLDVNGTNLEYLERPLLNYFGMFGLKEPQRVLDILYDTMDEDDSERGAYSEIASEDFDFTQGKIYSFRHLKKIFDHYYKISYDPNIYKIEQEDFEELFYFADTNSSQQFLDCALLEQTKTISLLTDYQFSDDICQEFNQTTDFDLKKLKEIYNIANFDKNKHYWIKCTIIFNTDDFQRNVVFDYDLKTTRIENIDKNFQDK